MQTSYMCMNYASSVFLPRFGLKNQAPKSSKETEKFEMKFLLNCKNNYLAEFNVFLEQS